MDPFRLKFKGRDSFYIFEQLTDSLKIPKMYVVSNRSKIAIRFVTNPQLDSARSTFFIRGCHSRLDRCLLYFKKYDSPFNYEVIKELQLKINRDSIKGQRVQL